jgi:hypothetical protein
MVLGILALVALAWQTALQSKEDHERTIREGQRDQTQQGMATQIAQLATVVTSKETKPSVEMNLYPPVEFDAVTYFNLSYHSNWTQDLEKRIRIAAHKNEPNNVEDFYARFIGVGYAAYHHDMTWAYVYKSQILMLTELNHRGGLMPLTAAQPYYDKGKEEKPDIYATYPIDKWIEFMRGRQLLIRHPTDMLEITIGGRDFLKYLTHYGRTADQRRA